MSGPALENMDIMEGDDSLSEEIMNMSTADIQARTRLLDNEVSSSFSFISEINNINFVSRSVL